MTRFGVIGLLICAPLYVSAAIFPNFSTLEIQLSPKHPHAGETVTLKVYDPSQTGSTAYVWSINGQIVDQGVGRTSIAAIAGALGSVQTIRVTAIENGQARGEATSAIRPADIDLVWEGKTTVPPRYLGLPLASGMSQITVLAIPDIRIAGSRIATQNVVFTWSVNEKQITEQSGLGKSSLTITPPLFAQPFQITVTAENTDGTTVTEKTITIQPVEPTLLMYRNAPLIGLTLHKEAGYMYQFSEDEVTLSAFPLFASREDTLNYLWEIDNEPLALDPQHPTKATFRKNGTGGSHTLTVSFENRAKFLEHGERALQLTF